MKWGIFDEGTKSTGERGSGRIYKNVAEFTKNASEGVLLLQEWEKFCKFAMTFQPKLNDSTGASTAAGRSITKWQYDTIQAMAHR